MYLKTMGEFLIGRLQNGNWVRTFSRSGKTITEILDSTGTKIIKERIKTIQRIPISGDVAKLCKKAFPNHENFSAITVGKVTNVFDDALKGKTTIGYNVNRSIVGKSTSSSKSNVLLREEGNVTNLFNGGVYEPDFHVNNPLWNSYWAKRNIKIGIDDTIGVPRNGNPFETINIPLEHSCRTGAWNRRIDIYTPKFDSTTNMYLGKDRVKGLTDLMDISTYNANECYSKLVNENYFW